MSYSDGLMHSPSDLTPVQVEAGPSDVLTMRLSYPILVEAYALLVTEDFTSQATSAVFSLDFLDKDTARTEIVAITIDETLKRGDTQMAGVTAIASEADIDVGDVICHTGTELPKKLLAGSTLILEHKTSAGGAGGAVVPMVLYRVDGYDKQSTRVLSLG